MSTDLYSWAPYAVIASVYLKWKVLDSALFDAQKSYDIALHYPAQGQVVMSVTASTLANAYLKLGKGSARP